MEIRAKSCSIFHGHALTDRGHYITISVSMTEEQMKDAIVTMLGKLPADKIHHLIREEFPSVLED
jgi:hypothetical protein